MKLRIDLISNRYHANPPNRAHVEGMVEWPPCPRRLMRAIASGGFTAGLSTEEIVDLLQPLSSVWPSYYLPKGSYLQIRTPRKDLTTPKDRAKTFDLVKPGKDIVDAYLNFDSGDRVVWVDWPAELSSEQTEHLRRCLPYCRYLGRREADAVWMLANDGDMPPVNAIPDPNGTVRVAGSDGDMDALLKSPYQALAVELRRSLPGLVWNNYAIAPEIERGISVSPPTFHRAQLAIKSAGKIRAESMLYWSDRLHDTLSKNGTPNFTGCDDERKPLSSHDHVFIQPLIEGDFLVGFELLCADGFTQAELSFLQDKKHLNRLYGKEGATTVRLVGLWPDLGQKSRVWESSTPFFLTRYPLMRNGKPRKIAGTEFQKDGPEHQALKGISYLPSFLKFGVQFSDCEFGTYQDGLAMCVDGKPLVVAWAQPFQQAWRWKSERKHGSKTVNTGYKIRFQFSEEMEGPIGIGYCAHFGLGSFQPQADPVTDLPEVLEQALMAAVAI